MKYPFLDLTAVNAPYMDEMAAAAERVIRSGRYVGGEEVARLEAEIGERLGAPFVVGVSNGLDALRLILRAYVETGIMKSGDEVIYPANTYIASVLAISDAGLVPVAVDVDETTMNIDTSLIEEAITERTRGIMTVHLYGRVAWDERLVDISRRHGLKIIEDCAQAFGARTLSAGLFASRHAGSSRRRCGNQFLPDQKYRSCWRRRRCGDSR